MVMVGKVLKGGQCLRKKKEEEEEVSNELGWPLLYPLDITLK